MSLGSCVKELFINCYPQVTKVCDLQGELDKLAVSQDLERCKEGGQHRDLIPT
jgi:hypothetical protein